MITKQELKNLPNSPVGDEKKEQVVEFVGYVMDRVPKEDALRKAYPERYKRAVERANGNASVVDANIRKEINQIERSAYAKSIYQAEEKTWWIKFLGKKHKSLETLYEIGEDEGEKARTRVEAIKVLLQFMPQAPQNIEVTHKVEGEISFVDQLAKKKRDLYKLANKADEDIIDAEVE